MSRENLKKARREAGLTQQQVADKLEITEQYYQKIERVWNRPRRYQVLGRSGRFVWGPSTKTP